MWHCECEHWAENTHTATMWPGSWGKKSWPCPFSHGQGQDLVIQGQDHHEVFSRILEAKARPRGQQDWLLYLPSWHLHSVISESRGIYSSLVTMPYGSPSVFSVGLSLLGDSWLLGLFVTTDLFGCSYGWLFKLGKYGISVSGGYMSGRFFTIRFRFPIRPKCWRAPNIASYNCIFYLLETHSITTCHNVIKSG